jgi:hypothetical protein
LVGRVNYSSSRESFASAAKRPLTPLDYIVSDHPPGTSLDSVAVSLYSFVDQMQQHI